MEHLREFEFQYTDFYSSTRHTGHSFCLAPLYDTCKGCLSGSWDTAVIWRKLAIRRAALRMTAVWATAKMAGEATRICLGHERMSVYLSTRPP